MLLTDLAYLSFQSLISLLSIRYIYLTLLSLTVEKIYFSFTHPWAFSINMISLKKSTFNRELFSLTMGFLYKKNFATSITVV